MKQFEQSGIVVFGISGDDLDSHGNFISKFNLNFSLLADTELVLAKALGSYGDQEWQGKVYKGISRDTFLLSPDGIIRHIWRKVDPSQTVSETFSKVRELQEYSW
jgi:peroxiredoxin Q/BCP